MSPVLVAAWLLGEGIVSWRVVHREHRVPAPGELLGITGLFLAGALIADIYPAASTLIVVGLFGLDVAAFLNVLPAGLGKQIAQAEAAQGKGGASNTAGESGSAAGEGSGGRING